MMDANSRRHWGGIFRAPSSYRFDIKESLFPSRALNNINLQERRKTRGGGDSKGISQM